MSSPLTLTALLDAPGARSHRPTRSAAYERVMLPRGFDAIDHSLRTAGQMFGDAC